MPDVLLEAPLSVDQAHFDRRHHVRSRRLRGLARNPALPGRLLRRLVDERYAEVRPALIHRDSWTDEQVETLLVHPDLSMQLLLAEASDLTHDQRAKLVDHSDIRVLTLAVYGENVDSGLLAPRGPTLPRRAYERLIERRPELRRFIAETDGVPADLRERLMAELGLEPDPPRRPEPVEELPFDRAEAEAKVASAVETDRWAVAHDPRLPADLVARLATDPSPDVRLAVSLRRELTDAERAAIDVEVGAEAIYPTHWATLTTDPGEQRRCVCSAHVGIRRRVACNRSLPPDLVAVLETDDDFAVRLMLCENQVAVSHQTVLNTFLESEHITRGRLLTHPAFKRVGLVSLADSPNHQARCLVPLDPEALSGVIERLSHDGDVRVRQSVAGDLRLSPARVLELFDDVETTGRAAANPHLPEALMERIIDETALLDE